MSVTLEAEATVRSVLARTSTNVPKTADGASEMIRQITIARDTARKGRTTAIITLKTIVVNSPAALRKSLTVMTDTQLLKRCSLYRPTDVTDTTASAKHALRALVKRWFALDDKIADHDRLIDRLIDHLTAEASQTLRDGYGIGADTAAEMLTCSATPPA